MNRSETHFYNAPQKVPAGFKYQSPRRAADSSPSAVFLLPWFSLLVSHSCSLGSHSNKYLCISFVSRSPILDTLQNRLLEIILQGVHQESGKISHGMSETLENLMRDLDLEHIKNSNNSTVKLKITLDISLPKIYKWLANVKRCSTSLAIRETQVKTTMTTLLHTH